MRLRMGGWRLQQRKKRDYARSYTVAHLVNAHLKRRWKGPGACDRCSLSEANAGMSEATAIAMASRLKPLSLAERANGATNAEAKISYECERK